MTDSENPVPVMFDHIAKVYAAMLNLSEEEEVMVPDSGDPEFENPESIQVYEGHLTGLFQDLNIPNPYYTAIMKALKAMNCVEQIRRGGGSAKSRWQLLCEPTEEGFMAYYGNRRPSRHQGQVAALEQRVNDLLKRVGRIEKHLERTTA